jgi:phosphate transport system substrate-binding protein
VTIKRWGKLSSVMLVGALALTACGSDKTSSDSATNSASTTCPKGTLNAEGSSAQKNAIEEASSAYGELCPDVKINYNPTGSGAGVKQFNAGQVDFAGSDSALKTVPKDGVIDTDAAKKRCLNNPAWNLPMITGPIAVAFKLTGVTSLSLTPEVAANLFQGKIATWNDPAIAAINPGVTLPAKPVKVFFRSDESGTTENFTKWMHGAAPAAWAAEPSKTWAGKGEGKEKSAGVTQGAATTEGGLTYVEWSFARDAKLGIAKINNGGGDVELTADSVAKAVSSAQVVGTGNDLALKLDYATKAPGAYPVILVSYEIACSKGLAADKTALVKAFLKYLASEEHQKTLVDQGYAPLPSELRTKVAAAVEAIS